MTTTTTTLDRARAMLARLQIKSTATTVRGCKRTLIAFLAERRYGCAPAPSSLHRHGRRVGSSERDADARRRREIMRKADRRDGTRSGCPSLCRAL